MPMLSIERRTLAPQPVLFVRLSAERQSFGYAHAGGHAIAGRPFVRYTAMGPGLITIEAGAPVAQPATGAGDVHAGELPGGPVVVALHGGPYDELQETYVAIERWMAEHDLKAGGAPWESYITDPAEHPDSSDWRTEVYWPVSSQAGPTRVPRSASV